MSGIKGKSGIYIRSQETKLKLSGSASRKRKPLSEQTKMKISFAQKGKPRPNKITDEQRINMSICKRKDKCHLWKGGISIKNRTERANIMSSIEYKLWRKSVFERDNYTCIWCGNKGYIEADHIKSFKNYPELRFAIDNGRTLCRPCHITTFKKHD